MADYEEKTKEQILHTNIILISDFTHTSEKTNNSIKYAVLLRYHSNQNKDAQ